MNHIPLHKLSQYLDDIMETQEKEMIASHITTCPECSTNLKKLQTMMQLLSSLHSLTLSNEAFTNTVMQKIRIHTSKKHYRFMKGSFIAAAIVTVALIIMLPDSLKHDIHRNTISLNGTTNEQIKLDCIIPARMDLNDAMMLLQQNNARILSYTNSSIIVESDISSFSSIRQVIDSYDAYGNTNLSNASINYASSRERQYPPMKHANKKKIVFRLQLR